jgi:hypothetical protein
LLFEREGNVNSASQENRGESKGGRKNEGKEKLTNMSRSAKLCGHRKFMPGGTFKMVDDLGVSNYFLALYRG